MLSDENGYLGAFGNSRVQRKTRKQPRDFPQILRFFNRSIIHPCLAKMPLNTFVLSLCSKVDLICTCAVQLVIAQSLQFS